jgi:hypothetical protein
MRRSYTVNVCRVETSPEPDYAGRVYIPSGGESTAFADECSIAQLHLGLVSRTTGGAGSCRVSWRHKDHVTSRVRGHLYQYLLGHTNSAVCSFLGHCRLGQKHGPEVLHSDVAEGHHHLAAPFEGPILALSRNANVDSGNSPLRSLPVLGVALGARQFTIRLFQGIGVVLGLVSAGQIEALVCGGGDFCYTPINSYCFVRDWECLAGAANYKGDVPVAFAVSGHYAGSRFAWQRSAPYYRDGDATSKTKNSAPQSECVGCVFQGRRSDFSALELRESLCGLLEGLLARNRPLANSLLLNTLRTFAKPFQFRTPRSEFPSHTNKGRSLVILLGFVCGVCSVPGFDALVPYVTSAVPFENQARLGDNAGAKAVRVPQRSLVLAHEANVRPKQQSRAEVHGFGAFFQ